MKFHNLFVFSVYCLILFGCDSMVKPTINCNESDLLIAVESFTNATGCNTNDGIVTVIVTGGEENYRYSINDGDLQSSPTFEGLSNGIYQVIVIDGVGCERSVEITISSIAGVSIDDLSVTDSGCGTNNGSITVSASGGSGLKYKLEGDVFSSNNIFSNLAAGDYNVIVKDDSGCEFSANVSVPSGISFATIKDIININCAVSGCHDGTGSMGSSRNWTVDQNIANNAAAIKTVINSTNPSSMMPPPNSGESLTNAEIEQITCWVDDGGILN